MSDTPHHMTLHATAFNHFKPTEGQFEVMEALSAAAKRYADTIDLALDNGPDKTYILQRFREIAMWVNVALTRNPDGSPRICFSKRIST